MKKVFHEDEDVVVGVELTEGQFFLHLEVKRWAPSVLKKLWFLRTQLIEQARADGVKVLFAYNYAEDSKWKKFMKLVGLQPLAEHEGHSIYMLETK